jgi:hypothetical protein
MTTIEEVTGTAIFRIRAGGSAQDLTVYIVRNGLPIPKFDAAGKPIPSTDPHNPGFAEVKVLPNGESLPERFTGGDFIAYLHNGQGGQPEMVPFYIGIGYTTYVALMGNATGGGGGGCGG